MKAMPSIKLLNVTRTFGTIKAIDKVSLEIAEGEYVCVLGPTGAGKTTLLRLMAGLTTATSGAIELDGKDVTDVPPENRNASYVPQQYALFSHMTVRDNVAFGPLARGFTPEESMKTAHEMLELVRLSHRATAYPHELSGGMQQRVALARGLAGRSPLLLLDEPLGAIDARLRVILRYELRRLAKELGVTALHVTHDQQEAMSIADRIAVLRDGAVLQFGRPSEIYEAPKSPFLANFVGGANFLEGVVVREARDTTMIDVAEGFAITSSRDGHGMGDSVIASFRQEETFVLTNASLEENVVPGKLLSTSSLGNFLRCVVDLGRIGEVVAKVPVREGLEQGLPDRVGDVVYVSANRDRIMIFDRPERPLAVELEAL
jgi:ABC-type Fe3+/spermidine/putrescine transport system ATPase subunit